MKDFSDEVFLIDRKKYRLIIILKHVDKEELMGERVAPSVDTDVLPVVVGDSCFNRCRKLSGKIVELIETAEDRGDDELALVCEGSVFLRACRGIVVRTGELTSTVAGPFFGQSNVSERQLYDTAVAQNEIVAAEAAFNQVRK